MKIKPLFDRIIVQLDNQETSNTGIFIGKPSNDTPEIGTVLYVGEGNENSDGKKLNMYIKEGDKILFNKFSGVETTLDKKHVYILRQTDVLAIID